MVCHVAISWRAARHTLLSWSRRRIDRAPSFVVVTLTVSLTCGACPEHPRERVVRRPSPDAPRVTHLDTGAFFELANTQEARWKKKASDMCFFLHARPVDGATFTVGSR